MKPTRNRKPYDDTIDRIDELCDDMVENIHQLAHAVIMGKATAAELVGSMSARVAILRRDVALLKKQTYDYQVSPEYRENER